MWVNACVALDVATAVPASRSIARLGRWDGADEPSSRSSRFDWPDSRGDCCLIRQDQWRAHRQSFLLSIDHRTASYARRFLSRHRVHLITIRCLWGLCGNFSGSKVTIATGVTQQLMNFPGMNSAKTVT